MQVDNRKVMGEALKEIRRRLIAPYLTEDQFWQFSRDKPLVEIIDSALAKKPRNCDIGTADEQAKRFEEFCMGHHRKMIGNKIPTGPCECPCYEGNSCNYFVWAQMPNSDD